MLGRAYECWGRSGDGEKSATAAKTASTIFESLGAAGDESTAATWRDVGDVCSAAGLDYFAADLYEEATRRDPARCGRAHWYFRRAELPKTGRGDVAAATRIFRGDGSRRRRGRDADIP